MASEVHGSILDLNVLAAEIDHLGTLVTAPDLSQHNERLLSIHQNAAEALQHRNPHQALQSLQLGLIATTTYRYLVEHEQISDLANFETLWLSQNDLPERAQLAGRHPSCLQAPSQVRALVERAANRAGRHYQAARAMARANTASSGLYYLGQAWAEVELGRLCAVFRLADVDAVHPAQLPAQWPTQWPDALAALRETTDLAYAVPGAAIDRHAEFIALNALLKELAELGEAGLGFGALDGFLEATLRLSVLQTSPLKVTTTKDLRRGIDRLVIALSSDGQDHSIALAYLERARATLDDPEADNNDRLAAERVVDQVLPAYLALIGLTQF